MPVPILKTALTNGRPSWSMCIGKHICSVLLQALIAIPCLSQPIGNWTFTGSTAGTGGTNNTVSAADFSAAIPTKQYNGAGEYFGEGGWPSGALDPNAYMQFSISPNTGYQLDLSSIALTIRRSTTGTPSGSGPTSWSLRSSLDGFTANIASNNLTNTYGGGYTVSLNSSFLSLYTTVTFRLYAYNVLINSGGLSRFVFDNISIQGIGSVLPVTFTGIQALRNNDKNVSLKWQVNNVQEGSVFTIQRSTNGVDFLTLNSFTENENKTAYSYNYFDGFAPVVSPALYYRIQGTTASQRTFFSPIVKISNKGESKVLIDYTSVQGQLLYASLQVPEKNSYLISVIGMNGAVLQQRPVELDAGVQVITLPLQSLSHGTYVMRLVGREAVSSKKFVF